MGFEMTAAMGWHQTCTTSVAGWSEDLRADFAAHPRGVIRLFNSPTGSLIREMLAESQTDRTIGLEFRDRFWRTRRELSRARLARGVELGQVRRGLDHELVLDAIYGPLWVRLFVGHLPMRPADGARLVDVVWSGIATPV